MLPDRQKPQPGLQVPVPTFPLSSPIIEEVDGSSCSSAEDPELERGRPFDFLVKSTRQKIEKSQKEENQSPSLSSLHRGLGESSRLGIRGITKKKKAAKPVGLNLVTNFSISAPSPQKQSNDKAIAPFVDLNDLKQLSRAREKERTAQKEKTKNSSKRRVSRTGQHPEHSESHNAGFFLNPSPEDKFIDRSDLGLSPSDRHVMIGLTVPYHESSDRSRELDIAVDQPLTPSIIVTPAFEEAPWSVDTASPEGHRVRATSSLYSQPTPRLWGSETDIPPVPAIPEEHSLSKKQIEDSEYLSSHFAAITRKRRSLSASTIFEHEIGSPDTDHSRTMVDDNDQSPLNRLSVNTEASRPQSQGWWNVLLSPLLGRSNTLSSKKSPLSPGSLQRSPSTPVTSTLQAAREKEISCFSPDTPETAVTNQWQESNRSFEESRSLDNINAVPPFPSRQPAMSMMLRGDRIQGEAAEYYQACAHELFSKTPFFDCFNHVCSITPPTVVTNQAGNLAAVTGDRGLALAEAEIGHTSTELKEAESAIVARGLLIDVDIPAQEASKSPECAKCSHLRVSTSSIDSWASTTVETVVGDNDKGSPELPKTIRTKELNVQPLAHEPVQPPPVQPPVQPPFQEPVPAPASAPVVPSEPLARELEPAPLSQSELPTPTPAPYLPTEPLLKSPPPQIINNYHYGTPPSEIPPQPPVIVERVMPHYIPVHHSNNPFFAPREQQQESQLAESEWPRANPALELISQDPPQKADITKMAEEFQDPAQRLISERPRAAPASQLHSQYPAHPELPRESPAPQAYSQSPRQPVFSKRPGGGSPPDLNCQHQNQAPMAERPRAVTISQSYSQDPPQEEDVTKIPEEFRDAPQEHQRTLEYLAPSQQHENHQTSEPISPGFQNAAGGPGSIPMSDVNAPAPAYAQHHRDTPLPERYDLYPSSGAVVIDPTGDIGPGEARRRRLEREDAAGKKIGGLWRGRGCFSKKGCFGRPGREGRLRRRWYICIGLFFLAIVVVAVILAITLTKKSDETQVQSQWVNLTNYPPIQTGIMTVAGTEPQVQNSGCINIETLWSCSLPKGTQQSQNEPYAADEPTFRVEIRYLNTTSNSTTGGSNSTTTKRGIWTADPSPPSIADQIFLGNTTDGNDKPYAGEETPFYLSVLSAAHLSSTNIFRRSTSNSSSLVPAPTEDSDGTAAAATLYPLPSSQPVRLYNRGESSEHYGFYTYFDKSIFLQSKAPLNDSTTDYDSEDSNGGSTQAEAQARCTWSQTRFLVQIWTNPSGMGYSLLSSGSGSNTSATTTATATSTSSTATSSSSATDYTRPGSFPYPVTVTVDRHGGDADKKRVYCYGIEDNGHYNFTEAMLEIENRSVGGTLINPASDSSLAYGGIDGGTGGCECQWVNWISTS
ncbi:hypothetical protein N7454_003864 [Penicillium verhagenii]|nr:hypothetical protein N7454_003864 [Penicillium verhagenii]